MTLYREYFVKVDELARARFELYKKAQNALADARKKAEEYPRREDASADYAATSAAYAVELKERQADFERVKRGLFDDSAFQKVREELTDDLRKSRMADPSALDANALELLKSGILRPEEYAGLLDRFEGNSTMRRLISEYAERAVDSVVREYGGDDCEEARLMRGVIHDGRHDDSDRVLQTFDELQGAYGRVAGNPDGMISHWDSFVEMALESAGDD